MIEFTELTQEDLQQHFGHLEGTISLDFPTNAEMLADMLHRFWDTFSVQPAKKAQTG